MTVRIADVRERIDKETQDCDGDGTAFAAWIEARGISEPELEHEIKTLFAFALLGEQDPLAMGVTAFRMGYELAVVRERSAFDPHSS